MIFHGRWVPVEVMDTSMLLGISMLGIIACVLFRESWESRRCRAAKDVAGARNKKMLAKA